MERAEYPFALNELPSASIQCPTQPKFDIRFEGNVRSDAQYFVCTGVLSLLYALAISVFYSAFDKRYQESPRIPLIDFAVTVILAIFWISAVAAWGRGTSLLGDYTDGKNLYELNRVNKTNFPIFERVIPVGGPSFSPLVISILFGVINFVLWSGNLWFLYKETTWFENIVRNSMPSTSHGGV